MRVLQSFYYALGSKPSFDQLPGMIDEYLREQNLSHRYFHYYLESFAASKWQRPGAIVEPPQETECERAAKDYPFLGPVRVTELRGFTFHTLHNFSSESNEEKADIYGIVPRLSRRHEFTDINLIYRDIDFFSRRFPTCAPEIPFLRKDHMGSGIILERSGFPKSNHAVLTVESRYPGEVPDARPYADALGQHLSCEEYLPEVNVILDEVEEARYEDLSRQAQPIIAEAKALFDSRIPLQTYVEAPDAPPRVAAHLKKLSAQYGYDYQGYSYYVYTLEKKLQGGHKISLEFVSHPRVHCADPMVSLCGLGFKHKIWIGDFCPHNSRDAKEYLTIFFEALAEVEERFIPAILELYPPTPDFYFAHPQSRKKPRPGV